MSIWIMKTAYFRDGKKKTSEKMYTNIIGWGSVWNISWIHRKDHTFSFIPKIRWHSDIHHYNFSWWRLHISHINHDKIIRDIKRKSN